MSKYHRLGKRGEVWEVVIKWPKGEQTHTLFSTEEDANVYAVNRAAEIAVRGWEGCTVEVLNPQGQVASTVKAGIGDRVMVG